MNYGGESWNNFFTTRVSLCYSIDWLTCRANAVGFFKKTASGDSRRAPNHSLVLTTFQRTATGSAKPPLLQLCAHCFHQVLHGVTDNYYAEEDVAHELDRMLGVPTAEKVPQLLYNEDATHGPHGHPQHPYPRLRLKQPLRLLCIQTLLFVAQFSHKFPSVFGAVARAFRAEFLFDVYTEIWGPAVRGLRTAKRELELLSTATSEGAGVGGAGDGAWRAKLNLFWVQGFQQRLDLIQQSSVHLQAQGRIIENRWSRIAGTNSSRGGASGETPSSGGAAADYDEFAGGGPRSDVDLYAPESSLNWPSSHIDFAEDNKDAVFDLLFYHALGPGTKTFVEIGVGQGPTEHNARFLRSMRGWRGLLLDPTVDVRELKAAPRAATAETAEGLLDCYLPWAVAGEVAAGEEAAAVAEESGPSGKDAAATSAVGRDRESHTSYPRTHGPVLALQTSDVLTIRL